MPRRVSLPSADDLFRPTAPPEADGRSAAAPAPAEPSGSAPAAEADGTDGADGHGRGGQRSRGDGARKRPSGRVRHDEKMTVYVTADELLDIEHARLALRRGQGLAVDRGRLVREAVALVLADYEAHGDDSALVRRLSEE
ncbi:hypothetical protein [Nocardioides sp. SYSU DS0663]|uniref:hypothetical protein n=1 Tax=Nocardioides sp. SYSU DS0663 TaxID=3416445 RepID=UPI003F4B77C3